jgi:hypothetical protein
MATILKPSYGASASTAALGAFTALNGLATSSTLLAGWSSAVQDNTSDLFVDVDISGILKSSTSVSALYAEIWAWGILDDTPTYPDTITGSVGAITLTSAEIKLSGAFARLGTITFNTTSNQSYPFKFSLAQNGFGYVPKKWGLWITQNSAAALNASNNFVYRTGIQYTNV